MVAENAEDEVGRAEAIQGDGGRRALAPAGEGEDDKGRRRREGVLTAADGRAVLE